MGPGGWLHGCEKCLKGGPGASKLLCRNRAMFMNRKNPNIVAGLLGLAAYLAPIVLSVVGSGMLLCYGEDGHVELEIAQGGSCGPVILVSDSEFPGSKIGPNQDHCGSCNDVPYLISDVGVALPRHAKKSFRIDPQVCASTVVLPIVSADANLRCALAAVPPTASPCLLSLRTVVLLI